MKTEWRNVVGYEGKYMVSNEGKIKSLARECGFLVRKEKLHKARQSKNGYLITGLSKNHKVKTLYIHRLVAAAFIPNPEGKLQVNHIDGDKLNNHVSNLEWCSARENLNHALKSALRVMPSGDSHWRRSRK